MQSANKVTHNIILIHIILDDENLNHIFKHVPLYNNFCKSRKCFSIIRISYFAVPFEKITWFALSELYFLHCTQHRSLVHIDKVIRVVLKKSGFQSGSQITTKFWKIFLQNNKYVAKALSHENIQHATYTMYPKRDTNATLDVKADNDIKKLQ